VIALDSRSAMRRTVFLYDDGVVLCATMRALDELGILEPSLQGSQSVTDLYPSVSQEGFGYLRAGLRSLAAQGWLALGSYLAGFDSNDPAAWPREWDPAQAKLFADLVEDCVARWRLGGDPTAEQAEAMRAHLDAALSIPALLTLRAQERLGDTAPLLGEGALDDGFRALLEVLGWIDATGSWTETGLLARDYVIHFGIVGSYLPLLARLPELYRGELTVAPDPHSNDPEWHVNRELNVIASAAAHRRYFADADEIFIDIFSREPLSEQPRFIADMGCGDGSWLVHLHQLVRERTPRGEALESEPLIMVGADCNEAALAAARRTLADAGVPGLLVFGDISDPEALRDTLAEQGLAIEDGLHIRSFLDHDRSFTGGDGAVEVPGNSSGAYVDPRGRAVDPAEVERDLATHLARWAPLVDKHGLVVLEAHCVAPAVASRHRGALHSVAFDSYHAYSHQYPVEYSSFIRCCRQAGFERVSHRERHYPSSRPFVAVSLNRFISRRDEDELLPAVSQADAPEHDWRPDPEIDLADGRGLHRLLFAEGDLRHPRLWCAPATGYVVGGALEVIEARIAAGDRGEAVRLLDYGAGTGLAAIELLKACRERGIDQRLEQREMQLQLHLADIPSSWFALGYELLRECGWVRFHSLRAADGGFRPLREVTGGEAMDAVMANMVFHLIPPPVLREVAAELAGVLRPGGRLIWSSPDLGPAGAHTVLFHDPNRLLRAKWLRLLASDPATADGNGGPGRGPSAELLETAESARAGLDSEAAREAEQRANRRILARPHDAADVAAALRSQLEGEVVTRSYEMLDEEILEAILVPSNQGEFISEIGDPGRRERAITELMQGEVLPEMRAGPAGTALGLNIQWTLGSFARI
jgi:SAM-dependent methyltransferase